MKRHEVRPSVWVFIVAAWLGLVTGLLEALGKLLLSGWNNLGWRLGVTPDILWIAPAFNLFLFLLVALGLAAALLISPKIPSFALVVFVLGFLSFTDLVGISSSLRT